MGRGSRSLSVVRALVGLVLIAAVLKAPQVCTEFLEESRFPGERYGRLQHRATLVPGVPIVFSELGRGDLELSALPARVSGIWRPVAAEAVDVIRSLPPETEELVVIAGHGTIGGRVVDLVDLGAQAGELGREILDAARAAAPPPPREGRSAALFDWRELRRWGLDERRLPPTSTVFPGQSFWQRYGTIIGLTGVSLLESALIVVLLLQWRRRRWAERSLTERLRFEEVLSGLYARFALLEAGDLEAESERSLAAVGEFLGVDRAKLVAPSEKTGFLRIRGWARPGVDPGPAVVSLLRFPWTGARLRRGEVVKFSRLEELPPDAAVDRTTYASIGARSHISVPLLAGDLVLGSIAFTTVLAERSWPDELDQRLQLLAGVLANVLARRRADGALRESRALSDAIVQSLPGTVVVVNRSGTIIATNHWSRGAAVGAGHDAELAIGASYLEVWRRLQAAGDRAAAEIVRGIQSVLDGTSLEVSLDHRVPAADGQDGAWFEIRVHPLRTASGGAVISRIDISERRRAAAETRRVREELARVGRLATVGELTAALAHEVKQPLTGILTNAQAARRLLVADRPDLAEIRSILDDIVADDQRAAGVIQRLRGMLKRREPELTTIDVNRLIEDVVRFLRTDAVIRNAFIRTELEPDLPTIRGDVVQLQQVLVNLVLNGLDAMREVPAAQRRLVITTRRAGDGVCVGVRDSGTGLTAEYRERIFEPFFSSKPEGMGLGLPIARSIVDAHGGRLWAVNNADCGATFFFTLAATGRGRAAAEPVRGPAPGRGRLWSGAA